MYDAIIMFVVIIILVVFISCVKMCVLDNNDVPGLLSKIKKKTP